jgi:hypothetical protein
MFRETHTIRLCRLNGIHRFLSRSRPEHEARPPSIATTAAITVRLSRLEDEPAIERLAQLCERAMPPGPSLVADVDGQIQAALPHVGREPLADPFLPMAELWSLLELRAAQLDASDPAWVSEDSTWLLETAERRREQTAPGLRPPHDRLLGIGNRSRRTTPSAGSTS